MVVVEDVVWRILVGEPVPSGGVVSVICERVSRVMFVCACVCVLAKQVIGSIRRW